MCNNCELQQSDMDLFKNDKFLKNKNFDAHLE